MATQKRSKALKTLSLSPDTDERLRQYAEEKHSNVSQVVTDWIWSIQLPSEIKAEREREFERR